MSCAPGLADDRLLAQSPAPQVIAVLRSHHERSHLGGWISMARLQEELRVERSEIVPVLQALNRCGRIEVILGHGPSAHRYRLKDTEFAEGQEKDDEEQGQAVSTSHTPKTAEDKPAAASARSKRTTRASLSAVAGKLAASNEAPFAITRIVQSDAGTIVVELDRPPETSRLAFSLSDVLELGHCAAQTVIRESKSAT